MINAVTQAGGVYGAISQQPNIEQLASGGANISFRLPKPPEHVVPVDGQQGIVENQIAEPTSWGQMVHRLAQDVNEAQINAGAKIQDVLAGGETPVHEAMVSMQEASVRFALLSEVRNKMVDAYQEIMRMQV